MMSNIYSSAAAIRDNRMSDANNIITYLYVWTNNPFMHTNNRDVMFYTLEEKQPFIASPKFILFRRVSDLRKTESFKQYEELLKKHFS